jgi:hypothetical protein
MVSSQLYNVLTDKMKFPIIRQGHAQDVNQHCVQHIYTAYATCHLSLIGSLS